MTVNDYTTIHHQLGFIEGASFNASNDVYDAILGAIATIEEIINKEMAGVSE